MITASEMAKRRWAKLTAAERTVYNAEMGRRRMAALTPEERTTLSRKGVRARRRKAKTRDA